MTPDAREAWRAAIAAVAILAVGLVVVRVVDESSYGILLAALLGGLFAQRAAKVAAYWIRSRRPPEEGL
jgi:hypothetical protein